MTVHEAAQVLGVDPHIVRTWRSTGLFPSLRPDDVYELKHGLEPE
jgi:hypothetical protein